MRISLELSEEELSSALGVGNGWTNRIEITVGEEAFKCHVRHTSMQTNMHGTIVLIEAEGYSKRKQEIADAVLLVNQTKEAHKEAQRKLAELQKEGK